MKMVDFFDKFKNLLSDDEFKKLAEKSSEGFEYLTSGHDYNIDNEKIFDYAFHQNQQIVVNNINYISLCKDHLLPFFGTCNIEYKSKDKILGFSRIKEIVQKYSLRLTIQEELTADIFKILLKVLNPLELSIILKGKHTCMMLKNQNIDEEIITAQRL